MILRQSLGSKFLPIHVLVAQFFMLEGFTIGYCAMIPVALAAYEMSRPRVRLGSTSALHEIAASKKRHQL